MVGLSRTTLQVNNMHDQTHTVSHSAILDSNAHTVQHSLHCARQDYNRSNAHAPLPSTLSWFSDEEDLSPRASKYCSDIFTTHVPEDTKSPVQCRATPLTMDAWRASTATILPGCATSNLKHYDADVAQHRPRQDKSKPPESRSFFKKYYERVKQAHRDAPPGETEIFWTGMRNYLGAKKKAAAVFEMCPPKRTGDVIPVRSSEFVVEQQIADRPLRQPPAMANATKDVDRPRKRQDSAVSYSDISRTSREVPIMIRRTILDVDKDKPLPPSPPLSAVPKPRQKKTKGRVLGLNKPLPRTPLPCFSEPPNPAQETVDESPVDSSLPPTQIETVGSIASHHQIEGSQQAGLVQDNRSKHTPPKPQGLRSLAKKTSTSHLHSTGKSKPSKADKAHSALKVIISRPIPIPPAVNLSLDYLAPHPGTISKKAEGKHKSSSSPNWLDRLVHHTMPTLPTIPIGYKGKKRSDSDESFACQGLGEEEMYAIYLGDGGPSVQDEGLRIG